jgi:hypothetical protein
VFIPGYPAWIWRLRPGNDVTLSERLHAALLGNAVGLSADDLRQLQDAAKEGKVTNRSRAARSHLRTEHHALRIAWASVCDTG